MITIRRLGPGDEDVVTYLSLEDPSFDAHPGKAEPLEALSATATAAFLADPSVLHWVAFDGEEIVGHMFCVVHPIRTPPGREVLLFEIGVHHERRRQGIGRRLMGALGDWLATTDIRSAWVLADDADATAFYEACGYTVAADQPTYLTFDR